MGNISALTDTSDLRIKLKSLIDDKGELLPHTFENNLEAEAYEKAIGEFYFSKGIAYPNSIIDLEREFGKKSNSIAATFLNGIQERSMEPRALVGRKLGVYISRHRTLCPMFGAPVSKDVFERILLYTGLDYNGKTMLTGVISNVVDESMCIALTGFLGLYWHVRLLT